MKKFKKLFVFLLVLTMVFTLVSCGEKEEEISWPEEPIEVIVPYAAGGDTDIWGRLWAQALTEELGVNVFVTNMTGSSGVVGADYVKNAEPDGYTVLFHHNALLTSKIMGKIDWSYDAFECANILVDDSNSYWFVNPEKFKNFEELKAYGMQAPGQLKMGCSPGSYQHLLKIIINQLIGWEPSLVDAGDAANSAIECIAGRLDTMSCSLTAVKDYVKNGQLVPVATYRSTRSEEAPDCPTWKELGYDVYGGYLYGTFFPKGTDQKIIDKWNKACEAAQKTALIQDAYKSYNAVELTFEGQDAVDRWGVMWDDFMSYEEFYPW